MANETVKFLRFHSYLFLKFMFCLAAHLTVVIKAAFQKTLSFKYCMCCL